MTETLRDLPKRGRFSRPSTPHTATDSEEDEKGGTDGMSTDTEHDKRQRDKKKRRRKAREIYVGFLLAYWLGMLKSGPLPA